MDEPDTLICLLTHLMFRDPVFVPDSGNTYERSAIEKFWQSIAPNIRDPLTNESLQTSQLCTNWGKRREVQEFLDQHPGYVPEGWDSRDVPVPGKSGVASTHLSAPVTTTQPAPAGWQFGTCAWFDPVRGFGFISPDNGGENIFVHVSQVWASPLRHLLRGDAVRFQIRLDNRGRTSATNVSASDGTPLQPLTASSSTPVLSAPLEVNALPFDGFDEGDDDDTVEDFNEFDYEDGYDHTYAEADEAISSPYHSSTGTDQPAGLSQSRPGVSTKETKKKKKKSKKQKKKAPKAQQQQQQQQQATRPFTIPTTLPIEPGATVLISGLESRADLNGKLAQVTSFISDSGRWAITVGSEQVKIKPSNITVRPSRCVMVSDLGHRSGFHPGALNPAIRSRIGGLQVIKLHELIRELSIGGVQAVILPEGGRDDNNRGLGQGMPIAVALRAFVESGGLLITTADGYVQGQGPCGGLFQHTFGKTWAVSNYCRIMFHRQPEALQQFFSAQSTEQFSVKGSHLRGVPDHEAMYKSRSGAQMHSLVFSDIVEKEYVSIACGAFGQGTVAYFSDSNSEEHTARLIAELVGRYGCRGTSKMVGPTPPSSAFPAAPRPVEPPHLDDDYDDDDYDDDYDDEYDDEYDDPLDEMGEFGFSQSDINELLCQGVKPWDDDAWDVLQALKGHY